MRSMLSVLFPHACAGCDGVTSTGGFCSICSPTAFRLDGRACPMCSQPMETRGVSLCARCLKTPPPFESTHALWEYDGAIADAFRRIKYGGDLPALRSLCRDARPWMEELVSSLPEEVPLIPMPSHPSELCRRGFHLTGIALRSLTRGARRQVVTDLRKVRETRVQASLPFGERRRNVRGAYRWRGPRQASGRAVIFDDVMTTGATAEAATTALLEAGFEAVEVIVLARAP
jgi:predicted amidophosphoribosyltransferase